MNRPFSVDGVVVLAAVILLDEALSVMGEDVLN